MPNPDRRPRPDADWRAVIGGALAAPTLVVLGLLAGWLEGGLLPGDCQGLACIYLHVLLLYGAGLLGVWVLLGAVTALTRERWPRSTARVVILRVLAVLSYAPMLWVLGALADVS